MVRVGVSEGKGVRVRVGVSEGKSVRVRVAEAEDVGEGES